MLPKELRERLASEIRIAATLMNGTEIALEKLYYFSVVYLEVGRIINWQWDADLVLIWLVSQQTQARAVAKVQAIAQGDRIAPLPNDYFDRLTQTTVELADFVENNGSGNDLAKLMRTFAELVYLTTGNGYYLTQKQSIIETQSPT